MSSYHLSDITVSEAYKLLEKGESHAFFTNDDRPIMAIRKIDDDFFYLLAVKRDQSRAEFRLGGDYNPVIGEEGVFGSRLIKGDLE